MLAFGSRDFRERNLSLFAEMADEEEKSSLQQQIDENLKLVYREVLDETVPERFRVLLEELRRKQSEGKS